MPQEIRKLAFSEEELKVVTYDYCLRTNIHMSACAMESLETTSNPEAAVILKYAPEDPAETKQIKLGRDQVGAALIRYCMDHKIPLPRLAQKVLQVQNNEVALMVSIHWKMKKKEKIAGNLYTVCILVFRRYSPLFTRR